MILGYVIQVEVSTTNSKVAFEYGCKCYQLKKLPLGCKMAEKDSIRKKQLFLKQLGTTTDIDR